LGPIVSGLMLENYFEPETFSEEGLQNILGRILAQSSLGVLQLPGRRDNAPAAHPIVHIFAPRLRRPFRTPASSLPCPVAGVAVEAS
jgi:hypothetical protein